MTTAAQNPLSLVSAALLGAWMTAVLPSSAGVMSVLSKAFVGLLQMAALPLMIVAVVFGLRRLLELPAPGVRLLRLGSTAVVMTMLACAVALACAHLSLQVWGVTSTDRAALGAMLDEAQQVHTMAMAQTPEEGASAQDRFLITPNIFEALAAGAIPSILIASLAFGLALHAQKGEAAQGMAVQLEAVYRTLESLIGRLNLMLPLAAWAMAGYAASGLGMEVIAAMKALLLPLLLASIALGGLCLVILSLSSRTSPWLTLTAMARPICISLLSPSAASIIPSYIEALSDRLGFSRGIVELLVPVAPVFLRIGEVVFFAVLLVFLCGLYQRPVTGAEWLLLGAASLAAAAVAVQLPTGSMTAAAAMGYTLFELPVEAILPHLIALEIFSQGLRQTLSGLATCVLVAVVTADLPTAPLQGAWSPGEPDPVWPIHLNRAQSGAAIVLTGLALLFVFLMGVGMGIGAGSSGT